MENHTEKNMNNESVISLVLGIVSLVIPILGFITAIIGIIFSIKSLRVINQTNEPGKGLSITGLVCSILSIIIHLIVAAFIIIFIFFAAVGAS